MDNLIPGGVSHLQYADDTLLLFQPDLHSIATVKALLISFELMSGLKINFHKSDLHAIHVSDAMFKEFAQIFEGNMP